MLLCRDFCTSDGVKNLKEKFLYAAELKHKREAGKKHQPEEVENRGIVTLGMVTLCVQEQDDLLKLR